MALGTAQDAQQLRDWYKLRGQLRDAIGRGNQAEIAAINAQLSQMQGGPEVTLPEVSVTAPRLPNADQQVKQQQQQWLNQAGPTMTAPPLGIDLNAAYEEYKRLLTQKKATRDPAQLAAIGDRLFQLRQAGIAVEMADPYEPDEAGDKPDEEIYGLFEGPDVKAFPQAQYPGRFGQGPQPIVIRKPTQKQKAHAAKQLQQAIQGHGRSPNVLVDVATKPAQQAPQIEVPVAQPVPQAPEVPQSPAPVEVQPQQGIGGLQLPGMQYPDSVFKGLEGKTEEELKAIANDPNAPLMERLRAGAMLGKGQGQQLPPGYGSMGHAAYGMAAADGEIPGYKDMSLFSHEALPNLLAMLFKMKGQ